jgi:hypothetical protein
MLNNPIVTILLRIYAAAAFVAAAVLSPLVFSAVPLLLLVWYFTIRRWKPKPVISLLTEYFAYFFIAVLLAPAVGLFSVLIALPVLFLTGTALEETAESLDYQPSNLSRRPTGLGITMLLLSGVSLFIGLFLSNDSLTVSAAVSLAACIGLIGISFRSLGKKPVREIPVNRRILAGKRDTVSFIVESAARFGGLLFLESPVAWVDVLSKTLSLKTDRQLADISVEPILAGPTAVALDGYVIDRWGLMQVRFRLEPVRLHTIPRARYADWLAKQYLAGGRPGNLPLVANIESLKPAFGLRRGIEYYGNQVYQPGDSLKNIDWKHSLQNNELIVREYVEFQGQSALILVNLTAGNAEEADTLAYSIIVTALSLVNENIPASLAVYDNEKVVLTTGALQGDRLVARARQITQQIVVPGNPVKYLNPPDVTRLRSNLNRLSTVENPAAQKLAQLLRIEYQSIVDAAGGNPAARAVADAFTKTTDDANVIIISHRNHDAEALALSAWDLRRRGSSVMNVLVSGTTARLTPARP